jgi:N-acetylglucosamine malate deacetylase 1
LCERGRGSEQPDETRGRKVIVYRLDHVRKAIAFGSHPDDVEVGAGGLVAKLVAAGASVTIDVASIPNQLAVRRAEALAAATQLGASVILPDGDAETRVEDVPMHALVARFERDLKSVQPDLVIVHGAHDSHWDHTLVHRAVLSAVRRTRCDILAFATRLPAGSHAGPPTFVVDITPVIDKKLAAIAEHRSQFQPAFIERRREIARVLGHEHGVELAEVFEAIRIAC